MSARAATVVALLLLAACGQADPAPAASASVSSSARVAPPRRTIDLTLDPTSEVSFLLSAPKEEQRARFTGDALRGVVHLDLDDPYVSTGEVTIDLLTLEMEQHVLDPEEVPWRVREHQSDHAKAWFGIDPKLRAQDVERYRFAKLRVLSIQHTQAGDTPARDELACDLQLKNAWLPLRVVGKLDVVADPAAPRVTFATTDAFQVNRLAHSITPAPPDFPFVQGEPPEKVLAGKVSPVANVSVHVSFSRGAP